MKTIYLNNSSIRMINEGLIKTELPDFLLAKIERNKTPFGNNPALPDIYDMPFLEKICKSRFSDASDKLKSMKKIDIVNSKDINGALSEIIKMCIDEERPYRAKLEALVGRYVINMFKVPEDTIELNLKLIDKVELNTQIIQFDKVEDDGEYEDVADAEDFKSELYKREILNAINIGYGMSVSNDIQSYVQDIYKINPKLIELYRLFILLSEYVLFTNDEEKLTEKNPMQIGTVELKLTQIDEMPSINAQASIFPVLLCESIRGFMELFSSHGLPTDKNVARQLLKRTDYIKAEPWYMRAGLQISDMIFSQTENLNTQVMPYLYRHISNLDIDDFNLFMKNVLAKTKKGKNMMNILTEKSIQELEDNGNNTMKAPNEKNSVIIDNYIREEEL